MVFPTARVGWVSSGGVLVTTRDGGASWSRVPLGGWVAAISRSGSSLWAFVAPCMANPNLRACSYRLDETTLDSETFHEVGLLPRSLGNFPPLVVTRLSAERALVAVGQMGAPTAILTTDGGKRWSSVSACAPSGFVAVDLATTSPSDAWALCLGGASMSNSLKSLARSTDGGETWSLIAADRSLSGGTPLPVPTDDGDTLAVPSAMRLWMVTVNSLFGSRDGGKRWFTVRGIVSDGGGTSASFSFVSVTEGWLLSPGSGLWRTTNGSTWRSVSASAIPTTKVPTTGPGNAGGPGPCAHAKLPLFYPSGAGADPTGHYVWFALDCTPNFAAQEPNPSKEFHPVSEEGQLVSSTEYQFMIPGVQLVSPTTEQPEPTLTVPGSVLTPSGNSGNQVTSVTMTEALVPVPGATDGSTTEGVDVTVAFESSVTSCALPYAFGLGLRLIEMDCLG